MFIISGGRGTGKTRMLLEKAYDEKAILVCEDTTSMRERAYKYGIAGLNMMSYEEFEKLEFIKEPVYIHNIHKYLEHLNKNVKGYSVCTEA